MNKNEPFMNKKIQGRHTNGVNKFMKKGGHKNVKK